MYIKFQVLGQAIVVNAPFLFSASWAVIRPWLDPVTANKVRFIKLAELPSIVDEEYISPNVGQKDISPLST